MKTFLIFIAIIFVAASSRSADILGTFESANKSYEEGKFADAVVGYDQLLNAGKASEPIYFNLGNAYFKLGQLGHAIESYRLAQRISPRDPDLRANLQLARTRARGGVAFETERWRLWLGKLSLNEWTALTLLAFWLMFLLLALTQWRAGFAPALRKYIVAAAALAFCFGVCLVVQFNSEYLTKTAIVTAGESDVRNGPLDESPALYKVRDGVELKVVDRLQDWLQVEDSVQRTGWIRRNQVLILGETGNAEKKS